MADFECKDLAMALSVLDTMADGLDGVKKNALLAVRKWVLRNSFEIPRGYEERKNLRAELSERRRELMTKEGRIEEARFLLDGLPYTLEVR
jgi:hypothetical protein